MFSNAVLGGVLTVLAPPVGISFLAGVVGASRSWPEWARWPAISGTTFLRTTCAA